MARTKGRRDHRESALALARAIHAAILAYNSRHPHQTSRHRRRHFAHFSRNDPDYHPPRKRRDNKDRKPTVNPVIFTVRPIARALETSTGELLDEPGFEVTKSDLRSFRG